MTDDQLREFLELPLPDAKIAVHPRQQRGASKLLVVDRQVGNAQDYLFADLPALLKPRDLLVFNRTRVTQALTWLTKPTGGQVELLWIKEVDLNKWQVYGETSKLKIGQRLHCDGGMEAKCLEIDGRRATVQVCSETNMQDWLAQFGHMPLPPYIRKKRKKLGEKVVAPNDLQRYQTVYAKEHGSIAAPTAGLHFDDQLLKRLSAAGIDSSDVLLTVGPGTFTELSIDEIDQVQVLAEQAEISNLAAKKIRCTAGIGRVVAVGTTSLRTLEGMLDRTTTGDIRGKTNITIKPGYDFKWVDGLITNFHMQNTTLRLLVAAMMGPQLAIDVYRHAIANDYRFYSYGDAMLIL